MITCLINYGGIITYLDPCGCLITVNFNHFKSSRVRHNKVSWWHLVALFRVFSVFLGTGNYRLATGAQHLPGSAFVSIREIRGLSLLSVLRRSR